MDTKRTGDISEQAVILQALKRGWEVSIPVGDRLPYDLIIDINGKLIRIQVKTAWYNKRADSYCANTRRSCTNRRKALIKPYNKNDFDFAIFYLQSLSVFYIMPIDIMLSYKGSITIVESQKRQRKPKSADYRETWYFLENF